MYATSQDPNLTAKQVRNVEDQNLQMKVIHSQAQYQTMLHFWTQSQSSMQNLSADPSLYNGPGRRGAYSATPTT
jgi:thioredoxin-like negative regulator of GroEL